MPVCQIWRTVPNMAQTLTDRTAANVRAEFGRAGKSAASVARDLKWSQSRMVRRLKGEIPFDVAELAELAAYLGVPLERLVAEVAA